VTIDWATRGVRRAHARITGAYVWVAGSERGGRTVRGRPSRPSRRGSRSRRPTTGIGSRGRPCLDVDDAIGTRGGRAPREVFERYPRAEGLDAGTEPEDRPRATGREADAVGRCLDVVDAIGTRGGRRFEFKPVEGLEGSRLDGRDKSDEPGGRPRGAVRGAREARVVPDEDLASRARRERVWVRADLRILLDDMCTKSTLGSEPPEAFEPQTRADESEGGQGPAPLTALKRRRGDSEKRRPTGSFPER
jgi:hypothetical protein